MKWPDLNWKIMFQSPHPMRSCGAGQGLAKVLFLGIAWNVKICKEKSCLHSPHHGMGWGWGVKEQKREKNVLVIAWDDLYLRISCNSYQKFSVLDPPQCHLWEWMLRNTTFCANLTTFYAIPSKNVLLVFDPHFSTSPHEIWSWKHNIYMQMFQFLAK